MDTASATDMAVHSAMEMASDTAVEGMATVTATDMVVMVTDTKVTDTAVMDTVAIIERLNEEGRNHASQEPPRRVSILGGFLIFPELDGFERRCRLFLANGNIRVTIREDGSYPNCLLNETTWP